MERRQLGRSGLYVIDSLDALDVRRSSPRFQADNLVQNLDLLAALRQIAADKGCTLAQLSLAWILAQGDDVVPIPGTHQRIYLEENSRAMDIRLTGDELVAIAAAFPLAAVAGDRLADYSRIDR